MKTKLALLTSTLALLILSTAVLAEHQANITISPDTWELGTETRANLTVSSLPASKSPITKVEITVPAENDKAIYGIKNAVGTPSGWIYEGTVVGGDVQKLVFTALDASSGIANGKSALFTLLGVTAPSAARQTIWNWKTFDAAGNESVGQFVTTATFGPLANFTLSDTPKEIVLGDTFTVKLTALDTHGLVKMNYDGRVVIASNDPDAMFTPAVVQFTGEQNGTATIIVAYNTTGTFAFTATDKGANIFVKSTPTNVLAPLPRELSIKINNDATSTTSREAKLTIGGKLASQCRFSNDRLFWTDYTGFTASRDWQLPEGVGVKTVSMQCKNSYGESEIISDSITVTTAPVKSPATGLIPGVSTSTMLSGLAFLISLGALYFSLRKGKKHAE